jgi:hypothetical protein
VTLAGLPTLAAAEQEREFNLPAVRAWGAAVDPRLDREPPPGETWIHQATRPAIVSFAARAEFGRFFSAYSDLLKEQMRDSAVGEWHFWVVMTQKPSRRGKLQILVSGRAGRLEVPIASFPVSGASKRVRGAVQRSVALSRDPFFAALLSGNPSALDPFLPGPPRK